MTESVMALPDGSPSRGVHSPPLLTRARARTSVTDGERRRPSPRPRPVPVEEVRARSVARSVTWPRRVARVMYRDAADSWIASDSTPSLKWYWANPPAAPFDSALVRAYYTAYHRAGLVLLAFAHGVLWMLIHPVRGPLFAFTAGGTAAAITYTLI